jgi:hypothetical protein
MNATGVPLWMFFGAEQEAYELVPDHVVGEEETLTIGGTEFRLYPAYGGETRDALLIYLPATGVLFTGDTFMPFIGAPFLPEGSAEGLLDTIELIQRISPRLLIHGHTPLTENMTVDVLPALGSAVRELYQQVLDGLRNAETLAQVLGRNVLPDVLRSTPAAVILYLLIRENLIKRVYHQRSGYWKPDGEGMEVPSADEWAAAVALLANGQAERFVDAARTLLTQNDAGLSLRIVELGLRNFPGSSELAELRLQALQELRVLNLGLNPFKFIVYSGWAESELAPGALA